MAKPPRPMKARRKRMTPLMSMLSKKRGMRKVAIISRKEQPLSIALRKETKVFRTSTGRALFAPVESVPKLERKSFELGAVSSSWISHIGYTKSSRIATMVLKNGYIYHFKIPFRIWEGWFYAHSKGTYFNYIIKDKYPYRRIR